MKKNRLISSLWLFLTVFIYCLPAQLWVLAITQDKTSSPSQDQEINFKEDFVVGKVLSVTAPAVNQNLLNGAGLVSKQQNVLVKVLEGPYKNLVTDITNDITDNPA